jgi:hypothetical protein
MTTQIQSSKGMPPSAYRAHLDRIISDGVAAHLEQAADHEAFVRRRRRNRMVRRLTWACWAFIALILAAVAWRGYP